MKNNKTKHKQMKETTTQSTEDREAEFKRLEERTRAALITAATKALEHASTVRRTRKQREIAREAEAIVKRLKKKSET
jgi:hypothetical protein